MRKKILFGNWKMNNDIHETKTFIESIPTLCSKANKKDVIIGVAPSYLSLQSVNENRDSMLVYAQEIRAEEKGAYTGDVSIPMIKGYSIQGALVGHSERRSYHGETNSSCNAKIKALIENNLGVIYCVGETLAEYEANKALDVISTQIKEGLNGVNKDDMKNVIIAYEPVWSIGTGKNASSQIAEDICKFIRNLIKDSYGENVSSKVAILYGGSVKPNNIHDYLLQEDVDGALVGGASLKADSFEALIENI